MYIVGFNGPPECGKDTLARMLAEHMDRQGVTIPVREESLSLPLRAIAYAMVGKIYWSSRDDTFNRYDEFKREYFPALDRTGRQLMIDASESFLKPVHGNGVMSKLLLARQGDFPGLLLIRDSGFQCEIDPLRFNNQVDDLLIVQVHRECKTFVGDSREWVYADRTMVVQNNGTLDDLRTEAGRIYGRLVNQYGWKL